MYKKGSSMYKKIMACALIISAPNLEAGARRAATTAAEAASKAVRVMKPAKPTFVQKPMSAEQQWKSTFVPRPVSSLPMGSRTIHTTAAQATKVSSSMAPAAAKIPLSPLQIKNGINLFTVLAEANGAASKSMGQAVSKNLNTTLALEANFAADASVQTLLTIMGKQPGTFNMILMPVEQEILIMNGKEITKVSNIVSRFFFENPVAKQLFNKTTEIKVTPQENGVLIIENFIVKSATENAGNISTLGEAIYKSELEATQKELLQERARSRMEQAEIEQLEYNNKLSETENIYLELELEKMRKQQADLNKATQKQSTTWQSLRDWFKSNL